VRQRRDKFTYSKRWLIQLEENRADYLLLGSEILQRNEPTYTLDEVMRRFGMDKYHLKFRTRRLQKKYRLEFDAT